MNDLEMNVQNTLILASILEAAAIFLWPSFCKALSGWTHVPQELFLKYFHVLLYSLTMTLCAVLLLIRASFARSHYLQLFDCATSSERGMEFKCAESAVSPYFRHILMFSIWFAVFDSLTEYIHSASKKSSTRYSLLLGYRLVTACNMVIVLQRNQFMLIAILVMGLIECTTFMLCLGHFLSEIRQNTWYLRMSCHIAYWYSFIGRILMPMLLMTVCLYHRFSYWIQSDIAMRKYGPRRHRVDREQQLSVLCGALHMISCIGITVANVWWTVTLKEQIRIIPISLYGTHDIKDSDKKQR